jgi:hypothetical protein
MNKVVITTLATSLLLFTGSIPLQPKPPEPESPTRRSAQKRISQARSSLH